MNHEDRINRLKRIYIEQETFSWNSLPLYRDNTVIADISVKNLNFDFIPYDQFKSLNSISDISEIDRSAFANWKITDIPVMITAGGLGTLSSCLLKDYFAELHDKKWAKKKTVDGGHSGENVDWVPGNKQPGGFGHRWKYGHDLLNPFEVNWEQYLDIAKESGGTIPPWLKAPFYWIRHLLQDSFSKEGLPVPGHSLLRYFLNPSNPSTREILQVLTTIKMRDLAGAAATNAIMAGYLWGTEKNIKKIYNIPNYRCYSLMLGANLITLLSGLLVPDPNKSFNHGTIPIIGYYSLKLIKLIRHLNSQIAQRNHTIWANDDIINKNDKILIMQELVNDKCNDILFKHENNISDYYNQTVLTHNKLLNNLCGEYI